MTAKPIVYLVNIGFDEYLKKKNKYLPLIAKWIQENGGGPMLPFSADFERQVSDAAGSHDRIKRDEAAKELGSVTMVPKIAQAGYNHL